MMQKIKHFVIGGVLTGMLAMNALVIATPTTAQAAACNNTRLLTFPAWYKGVVRGNTPNCEIISPTDAGGVQAFILKIVLNIIEILLQVVAYAAVGFIIWGGIRYMRAVGDSSKLTMAKDTIRNAVIGLVISIASVAIINLVGQNL